LRGSIAERGKLHITLLGMEFIRKLERFEMRGRELVLVE
jgi:predicted aspartyl protease